jgi:hypothetical protein
VGWALSSQVGHADITNDTVESYQKNGITVAGPGSTADIEHDVVTGSGPTPIIAQNGIQISFGATALVMDNLITANNCTGHKRASSSGILAFGGGGTVFGAAVSGGPHTAHRAGQAKPACHPGRCVRRSRVLVEGWIPGPGLSRTTG